MGFLWVNGFSFFHCVASPFHSFVTTPLTPEACQPRYQKLFYTTVKVGWHGRSVSFLAAHPLAANTRTSTTVIKAIIQLYSSAATPSVDLSTASSTKSQRSHTGLATKALSKIPVAMRPGVVLVVQHRRHMGSRTQFIHIDQRSHVAKCTHNHVSVDMAQRHPHACHVRRAVGRPE